MNKKLSELGGKTESLRGDLKKVLTSVGSLKDELLEGLKKNMEDELKKQGNQPLAVSSN